jgi:hypothetical protein
MTMFQLYRLCSTECYGKVMLNSGHVRIWKEPVLVCFNVLFRHSPGKSVKNTRSLNCDNSLAKIRNRYHPNTSLIVLLLYRLTKKKHKMKWQQNKKKNWKASCIAALCRRFGESCSTPKSVR